MEINIKIKNISQDTQQVLGNSLLPGTSINLQKSDLPVENWNNILQLVKQEKLVLMVEGVF